MSADTDLITGEREAIKQYADWYSQQGYQVSVDTLSRHRRREREFALALRGAPATINSIPIHRAGVPDP